MGLTDRVTELLKTSHREGTPPVPSSLQGVTKDRIRAVLRKIDRETDEIVDAVFALLDNQHESWFTNAPAGTKLSAGASTAHIACHVGILQRNRSKLDREGRDYWIKPLRELGAIEPVYLNAKTGEFLPGHPVAKSSNSAYRLAEDFKVILQASDSSWKGMLETWVSEANIRQRLALQAELAVDSRKRVDTGHSDLIKTCSLHYVPKFLPGFEIIYIDATDGDRITASDEKRLTRAGIKIGLGDAMPDILLWNPRTQHLWVIEAVTSDGEVDSHKVHQLEDLTSRSGKPGIGFTTAYKTWKDAAARQGKFKNIAPDSYIWIMEDPSKHFHVCTFPE